MKIVIAFLLILSLVVFAQNGRIATVNEQTGGIVISDLPSDFNARFATPGEKNGRSQLPGWPQTMSVHGMFRPSRGVALADIDNDDTLEVVVSSNNLINVYRYDGTLLWSKTVINVAQYAPAVADVNNDGWLEVIQTTRGQTSGGRVYLLDHNGNDLPGWPVNISNHNFACSAAAADVDGDTLMEIIVGERAYPIGYLHCLKLDGTELNANWPVALDHVPAVTAAIGDVNNDGQKEIVYCSYQTMYVLDLNGSPLTGWPKTFAPNEKFSYQSPLLVDLNGDNALEIIAATHGTVPSIHVFDYQGNEMSGWPFTIPGGTWTYGPPTAVAPPGSGDYKIYEGIAGSITQLPVVYGLTESGSMLPNFPIYEVGGAEGHIAVADIDDDGEYEVIFDSNVMDPEGSGYIHAYNQDGSGEVTGFPLQPTGFTYMNGVNLGDLDKDGTLDLVTVSYNDNFTYVNAWSLGTPYHPERILFNTYHADNSRDGLYRQPEPSEINQGSPQAISDFRVSPVYPNPFNGQAQFRITIHRQSLVNVRVYNVLGELQLVLFHGQLTAGTHSFHLQSSDFASGIYFLTVTDSRGQNSSIQKLIIMK